MMKRVYSQTLLLATVFSLTLLMAACSGQESSIPDQAELTPTTGATGSSATDLNGTVMDGYLRDATVWLDINENYQWDEGEPRTTSGEGGSFSFSLRDMGDLGSPRQYRLMVHALPGVTVDEDLRDSGAGTGEVTSGFVLTAPPGNNIVSPLTTLVVAQYDYLKQRDGVATYGQAHNIVRSLLSTNVSLLQDYQATNLYYLYGFARALVEVQMYYYNNNNMTVADGLLSQIDADAAKVMSRFILRMSPSVSFLYLSWTPQLNSSEEVAALNYQSYLDLFTPGTGYPLLANPDFLYKRIWHVSANSTSLQIADDFSNYSTYFPINSDTTIADDYSAPDINELLINTKVAGIAQFTRDYDGRLYTTRIDGGVDYNAQYAFIRLNDEDTTTILVDADHSLFSTEILPVDGSWDLITSVVRLGSSNATPTLIHRISDEAQLTELSALLVDNTFDAITELTLDTGALTSTTATENLSGTVISSEYQFDANNLQLHRAIISGYDAEYTYNCFNGNLLEAEKIYSTVQADVATACAGTPDLGDAQIFRSAGLLPVWCYTTSEAPGYHFCRFHLHDESGKVTAVITRRRVGAIVENLDPNDGDLIQVEERIYLPLAEAMEQEFSTDDDNPDAPPDAGGQNLFYPPSFLPYDLGYL